MKARRTQDEINMKIVYVKEEQIYCDGEDHDHPRVYYNLAKKGEAICGYCNIKYVLEKK
jgi:uncharacterized Zn-finger protein